MADKKISALTGASTPLAGTEVLPIVQSGSTVKVAVSDLTLGRTVRVSQLGVGTTAPTHALDVILSQTQITSRVLNQATSVNSIATQIISGGNGAVVYQLDNDGLGSVFGAGVRAGTTTNNFFNLRTNNVDRVSIAAAGDVTVNTGNLVIGTAAKGIDFSANTHAAGMTSELLDWYEEGTWTGTLTAATPPTTPITKTGRYTRIGNQITVAIEFDNVDTTGASGAMEVTGLPFAAVSAGYGPVMKSGIGTQVIMAGIYGGFSKVIFSDAGTMSTTSIVAGAGVYLRFSATYYV